MNGAVLLKRNFWIVTLALTALLALTAATGVAHFAGIFLTPDEKAITAPPLLQKGNLSAPPSSAAPRVTVADAILARNPFDSTTGPLNRPPPAPAEDEGQLDLSDPKNAPACDGVKLLIIAASSDPEWSFAAFSGSDSKSVLRRRGQEVGGKKIEYVGWDRVWMRNGNTLCQAEMFKQEGAKVAEVARVDTPPVATTGGRGAPSLSPEIAKGIQKMSANEFNVDRGVVDRILENQADLMRQARIVPEQENGKMMGIRLFGVRADTLLGVLGMENGDRLQTINGFDMASPEKALEAYARLRTADHLTVQVNRRGQNMNLDYNIK